MGIMLGNLSVEQIEKRLKIEIPEDLKEYMSKNRQENISKPVESGKWHCFDIPFMVVCGGKEAAIKFRDSLSPLSSEMNCQLHIGVQ